MHIHLKTKSDALDSNACKHPIEIILASDRALGLGCLSSGYRTRPRNIVYKSVISPRVIASLVEGVRVGPSKETHLLAVKCNNIGVRTSATRGRLVEEKTHIKSQASFTIRLQAE
jgi:hypothetical protein